MEAAERRFEKPCVKGHRSPVLGHPFGGVCIKSSQACALLQTSSTFRMYIKNLILVSLQLAALALPQTSYDPNQGNLPATDSKPPCTKEATPTSETVADNETKYTPPADPASSTVPDNETKYTPQPTSETVADKTKKKCKPKGYGAGGSADAGSGSSGGGGENNTTLTTGGGNGTAQQIEAGNAADTGNVESSGVRTFAVAGAAALAFLVLL